MSAESVNTQPDLPGEYQVIADGLGLDINDRNVNASFRKVERNLSLFPDPSFPRIFLILATQNMVNEEFLGKSPTIQEKAKAFVTLLSILSDSLRQRSIAKPKMH